jgi:hypothetical protein
MVKLDVGIEGWMDIGELEWLYLTAKLFDSVCEIGSWKGRSARALALSGCPHVYCVDHWLGSVGERGPGGVHEEATKSDVYNQFWENVKGFGSIHPIKANSVEASAYADRHSMQFDMVFIDAQHEYGDAKEDIALWLPKTRRLICGHDYCPAFKGVQKAVDEAFGTRVELPVGSIWAVRVREDYE